MSADAIAILNLVSETDSPNWHEGLVTGLPAGCFSAIAQRLGISERVLADRLHCKKPSATQSSLDFETSNTLYRVAMALAAAKAVLKNDLDKAAAWLISEEPGLRGQVPLCLLASHPGADYVQTFIERKLAA